MSSAKETSHTTVVCILRWNLDLTKCLKDSGNWLVLFSIRYVKTALFSGKTTNYDVYCRESRVETDMSRVHNFIDTHSINNSLIFYGFFVCFSKKEVYLLVVLD